MKLEGSERSELGRDEIWAKLSNLEALGQALPAAENVALNGSDSFEADFRPRTGLGVTPISMSFEVLERNLSESLVVRGTGGSGENAVNLVASFKLSDRDAGTEIAWSLDLHLHGVIRSLTQRVIGQLASQQVAAVLAALEQRSVAAS